MSIYVASRTWHAAMWRKLRESYPITSTWIDAGEVTESGPPWIKIIKEVQASNALVLYIEPGDLPLKGALAEVGVAMGAGIPVFVATKGINPGGDIAWLGTWAWHPLVTFCVDVRAALTYASVASKAITSSGVDGEYLLRLRAGWADERDKAIEDAKLTERRAVVASLRYLATVNGLSLNSKDSDEIRSDAYRNAAEYFEAGKHR